MAARREGLMQRRRRVEMVATVLGTAPLLVLGFLIFASGIRLLGDAWDFYVRRADAQLMWFGVAWDSVRRLTYAVAVVSLVAAAFWLPSYRALLILVNALIVLTVAVWAFTHRLGTAGPGGLVLASVIAGVCALAATIVLFALRAAEKEP